MKKTILLTTITLISAMAINKSSAQYYNGYPNDNRAREYYHQEDFRPGFDRGFHREDRELRERIDFNTRRVNELQNAMQEDRNCGNWDALHYHERELQNACAELNRAREIEYHRFHDDRRDGFRY